MPLIILMKLCTILVMITFLSSLKAMTLLSFILCDTLQFFGHLEYSVIFYIFTYICIFGGVKKFFRLRVSYLSF